VGCPEGSAVGWRVGCSVGCAVGCRLLKNGKKREQNIM